VWSRVRRKKEEKDGEDGERRERSRKVLVAPGNPLQASLWRDLCLQKKASCFFPIDLVESDSPCGLNGRARCSVRGLADLLPSGTLFRRGRNQSETGNLMVEKR